MRSQWEVCFKSLFYREENWDLTRLSSQRHTRGQCQSPAVEEAFWLQRLCATHKPPPLRARTCCPSPHLLLKLALCFGVTFSLQPCSACRIQFQCYCLFKVSPTAITNQSSLLLLDSDRNHESTNSSSAGSPEPLVQQHWALLSVTDACECQAASVDTASCRSLTLLSTASHCWPMLACGKCHSPVPVTGRCRWSSLAASLWIPSCS